MMRKARSQGKTTVAHDFDPEALHAIESLGVDVTGMLGNLALESAANGEAARAEWEFNAKRSAFFLQVERMAQAWATDDISMPALLRSALFRTTSDAAMLSAWGWQL